MSSSAEQTIPCPRCRVPAPFLLWESVNATLNPELKEKLLSHELFRFACPACKQTSELVYPLLYHDQQQKLMVWLLIPDEHDEISLDRASLEMEKTALEGYRLRLVTTANTLIEKILIFDSGLDDRVIEFIKAMLWQDEASDAGFPREMLFFSGLSQDSSGEKHLTFVQLRPSEEPLGFDVGWENVYQAAKALLHGEHNVPRIEDTHWRRVGQTFGERVLKNRA